MGVESYPKVRVTTDIVILTTADREKPNERTLPTKGIQVLLVKRKEEPYKDTWTLPGGFVDFDRPISDTVYSKLRQKTGVYDIYIEQLYTYGDDVNRDPRDRVISVAYIALVSQEKAAKLDITEGNSETAWFWVDTHRDSKSNKVLTAKFTRVDNQEQVYQLGFDHRTMVIDALNRVGNKVLYTDIGFNLVNKNFTIKELQMAYETLAGVQLPSFRRIIMPRIVETGLSTSNVKDKPDLYRPAKLYTKREV